MEALSQTTRSLLVDTQPDNVEVIVDLLTEVELTNAMEFEQTVCNMLAEISDNNVESIVDQLAYAQLTSEFELQQSVTDMVAEICQEHSRDNMGILVEGTAESDLASDAEFEQPEVDVDVEIHLEEIDPAKAVEIEQTVNAVLAQISPDNVEVVSDRLAEVELSSTKELEKLVAVFFNKVLTESSHCEIYADMVSALRTRNIEIPSQIEGEKPCTFFRILLNTCQEYFESSATFVSQTNKQSLLSCMNFFGHLYLRKLLGKGAIGQVFSDLVGAKEDRKLPEEHSVDCVCKLLQIIGRTLDETADGQNLMGSFILRLQHISMEQDTNGIDCFSDTICCQIQELIDLRAKKWQIELCPEHEKKNFDLQKEIAPTMPEDVAQTRKALEASEAKCRRLEKELQSCQCKMEQQLERQRSDEQQIAELTHLVAQMRADKSALNKLSLENLEALQDELASSVDYVQRHRMSRLQRQVEDINCKICLERPRNVVLLPCKHMVLCAQCLSKAQCTVCPVCRADIQDSIETF